MATYKIDPAHTEITFKVRHMMITNVTGSFTKFEGKMESSKEDFTDAEISFTADIESINTHNEQRDGHLRTGDFFDAAQYPQLSFVSTSFNKIGNADYKLNGNLTMHGVTKPVSFSVEFGGSVTDQWNRPKVGFEISGSIHRKEFGLEYNAILETGGVALSDEVKLLINVQLIKEA